MDQMIVGDVLRERRDISDFVLVSLRPYDSVATALRILQGHKISGAPVVEDHSARSLRSASMLDLMDLALAIMESGGSREVFNTPVRLVAGCSRGGTENRLPFIYTDATLAEGVRIMHSSRSRRLLVLDQATDRPVGLLTQTDVTWWALTYLKHLPAELMGKPVSQLKHSAGVVVAKQDDPMSDALRRFVGEKKTGVAVVDNRGRLVANLSLADLRCLTPENAHKLLALNVQEFLNTTHELPKDPVSCRPNTAFSDVLHLLRQHHIHRVYVTDEQEQPVAVFSSTDAIDNLCPQ